MSLRGNQEVDFPLLPPPLVDKPVQVVRTLQMNLGHTTPDICPHNHTQVRSS